MSRFGELFVFRVGSGDPVFSAPEPGALVPAALGIAMLVLKFKRGRYS